MKQTADNQQQFGATSRSVDCGTRSKSRDVPGGSRKRRPDPRLAAADLPQHVTQEGTRARRFRPSPLFGQSVNQQVNQGYGSLAQFQNGRSGSVARGANAEYEDERERMKRERNARESENAWKERENVEKERKAKEEKEREERERERKAREKKEREEVERKAKEERERKERERKAKEQKEREVERELRKARETEERDLREEQRKENERKAMEEARARKISDICDLLDSGKLTDVVDKYERQLPGFIESGSIPLDLIEKSLKNLSDRVVLQYFRKFYGTYELRELFIEAIALRAKTVLSNELFEELQFEAVKEILSLETLCVHEITVLLAVRSWLKHGWSYRKNYMKDVMSLVRFGSMSMFDVHLDPCFSEAKQPKELHLEGLIERILTDEGRPRWRSLDTMPLSLEEGASPFHCPQFKGEDFVLEFSVDKPVKFAAFFQYATLHNLAKQTGIQRVKWSLFKEGTVVAGPFNIIEHHFEKATFASGTSSVQLEPEKLYVLCASFSAPVKCFECPPKQFVLRDERYATPDVTCTIERAYCELSHNETELHVSPFYKLFFISSTPGNGMPCIPDDARYMKQRPTRASGLEEFSEPPTISPPLPVYYHVSIGKEMCQVNGERLRSLSPYWKDKKVTELEIDHAPSIVRPFILFANTGCLPNSALLTREEVVGLYDLGKCYEITDEAFNMQLFTNVQNHVSDDHGALLFYYKNLWEYPDVRKMCAKGFLYDAEQILSQLDAVKELGFEPMDAIFSMDPLEVHELTMFKALIAWASEPRRNKGDVIALLRKIRFGAFPLLDYYSASGPFHAKGLLNVEEKMKVVRQISSGANSGFSPKARLRSKDVMEVHLTRGLIDPRDSETDVPYATSFVVSKPVRVICMYKITGSRLTDQLKVRWALMEGVEGARHPNGGPFTEQLVGNLGNSPHIVTDQKYPVLQLKRDTVYTLVATFSASVRLTKMTAERKFSLEHPSYSNVVCEVLNGVPQGQGLQQNHLRAAFNEYGSGYGQYNDRIDFSAIYNADVHSTPFTTLYFLPC